MTIATDILLEIEKAMGTVGATGGDYIGTDRTLKKKTIVSPSNPTKSPITTTVSYTIRTLFTDYKDYYVNGTTIKDGDRECIISLKELNIVPAIDDIIVDNSVDYKIIDLDLPEVGGTKILAVAKIRK